MLTLIMEVWKNKNEVERKSLYLFQLISLWKVARLLLKTLSATTS